MVRVEVDQTPQVSLERRVDGADRRPGSSKRPNTPSDLRGAILGGRGLSLTPAVVPTVRGGPAQRDSVADHPPDIDL